MSANLSFAVVVGLTRFLPCKSMSAEKFGTKELYYTPAPTLVVSCGERDRTHTHITPNKCRRFGSSRKVFGSFERLAKV